VFVVDDEPHGPLYSSCPCPCRCHDDRRITVHTVPVRGNQACCRCPFMPRAQALRVGGRMGLGDDVGSGMPSVSQIKALQKQVNRYVGATFDGVTFLKTPLPVTGVLDTVTAQTAAIILWKRAFEAYTTYGTQAERGLLTDAAKGMTNAVQVVSTNITGATSVLQRYGDIKGLPPAPTVIQEVVSDPRVLAAGGVAAVLWFFLKARR